MIIRNLSFSYGEKRIFKDFTIELPDEGITAVTGPSGCGKTTLLRLIAGLEKPEAGVIDAPSGGEISVMFQEDRLLKGVAASKQLTIAVPGCDASYWLEAVGLKGEEQTLPEKLSGGMKRRLSLARALIFALDKRLLILDEPFTGVDSGRIGSLMKVIRGIGIPVIMSTHTLEAVKLADKTVEL